MKKSHNTLCWEKIIKCQYEYAFMTVSEVNRQKREKQDRKPSLVLKMAEMQLSAVGRYRKSTD